VKRILFLSSSSGPGGAERVLSKLAASVDRERYSPIVGLFRPGWLRDECDRHGVPTRILPSPGNLDIAWVRTCLRLLRQERVALIHSHEFDANVHGALAAWIAGIPQIATIHGKHYYWERARRRFAYRCVSRWAKMVTVSEDLRSFVSTNVGIPAHRLQTLYNGIEILPDVEDAAVEQLRNELGINPEDQVIGSVGSLYPVKGHQFLVDALPAVFRARPRTVVVIVGRGELDVALKDQVKRLGLEGKVHFLGLRQDIPRLLALMDVFVMPSLSEGLSIALLEAMAARKPVVTTRVGGNPEIVVDGETGYLVPVEDSHSLASAIFHMLTNPDQAIRFGENGRRRVEERFSLATMAEGYQKLYAAAIEESVPGKKTVFNGLIPI
jgi:glycosyltransferase involved in cell wall biosynthesis